MARQKAEPSLSEVLSGVDIIGTMLHTDLPRLEEEITAIRETLAQRVYSTGRPERPPEPDVAAALDEIRDLLQAQLQRMEALERRISQLADICSKHPPNAS